MSLSDTTPQSKKYSWFVLLMMVLLYLVNVADRYLASGLLEEIKKTFEVSDTFMGFLVGPAFAVVYTLLAIPIARLADKRNRVRIIVIGAIVWSCFTVLSGIANTPWAFALSRLGVGVGEAAFLAPAFSLLSDYFPPKKRAFAFAILNFGVLGLLTLILVKEPARGRLDTNVSSIIKNYSFSYTLKILWHRNSFRFMTIGTALGGFASYGFGIWAPTLFSRGFELSLTEANARYGGPSFIAGITGALIIGVLCDRLTSKDDRWPFWLSAIGLIGFFISMTILCFVDNVNLATILTLPAGLMAGGWVIAMQAALQDLLPAQARATGTALWAFALTFTGLALGVQFVGVLNELLTSHFGDQAIRYAMAVTLLAALPSVWFILIAGKTFEVDREYLSDHLS